jgi:hypothetical protein
MDSQDPPTITLNELAAGIDILEWGKVGFDLFEVEFALFNDAFDITVQGDPLDPHSYDYNAVVEEAQRIVTEDWGWDIEPDEPPEASLVTGWDPLRGATYE